MSALSQYTVGPHGREWLISFDDSTVISLSSKETAVATARQLAAEAAPSRLLIVDFDGSMQEEFFSPIPPQSTTTSNA